MTTVTPGPCDAGIVASARPADGSHPRATLATTILGSSLAFIDGSVINVALPAIGESFRASPAELSWTINAYLLPLGALILLGGAAGDHYGRRRLFLIGLTVFTLASLICAVAPNLSLFLAGRGLQGIGAALLLPNSLAILGAAFEGESRGRAVGTWAAVGALAGACGPLLGGWLVDAIGWRTIFLLNLPVAAAAGWLGWVYVTESHDRNGGRPLDWLGALLATTALALLTWGLTASAEPDANIGSVAMASVAGVAALGGFFWIEARRGDRAIMPFALFATRTFMGLTLLTFFLYAAFGGLMVLLPFLLIEVGGYSAAGAGAALLPLPILIGLGSPLMGKVIARIGDRLPLAVGSVLVGIGLVLYWRIDGDNVRYLSDVLPATLLVSVGMAICVAPLTASVMSSVDSDHVGVASGFNSAVARVGGMIATALLGFVFAESATPDSLLDAFRTAALAGAILATAAAMCALSLIAPRRLGTPIDTRSKPKK